jgi:nanoRNase/pAp phosphatase (c-di-AMP/oligoRNAs hydrolase)
MHTEKIRNKGIYTMVGFSTERSDYHEQLQQFKDTVHQAKSVLILTHDYPDPDCIASALGLKYLLHFWGIEKSIITFGGFVGRAENRAMIQLLKIPTSPLYRINAHDFDITIMVDSFPGNGNVTIPLGANIVAVFDHHPNENPGRFQGYCENRVDLGSTSTLITLYLLHAQCPIPSDLATALFFGIKADTGDMRRAVSSEDLECYKYLFDHIDHKLLSLIEHPDRNAEFYQIIFRAAHAAAIYDTVGYTHLGDVTTPDYIAEMADFFHHLENLEWMTCSGFFKDQLFYSIRSLNRETAGKNAEAIAEALDGSGGGHAKISAGRVPVGTHTEEETLERFMKTFKTVFRITHIKPRKLLSDDKNAIYH